MSSMKKLFSGILLAVGLSGCSYVPVTQDYSQALKPQPFKSFQWLPGHMHRSASAQSLRQREPFIAQRIEQAIANHMQKRGSQLVRRGGEVYISYNYALTQTQVMEPSTTIGFGWGSDNVGFATSWPLDYELQTYEEARWVVDIHDRSGRLIWRGESKRSVENFSNPQAAADYTQRTIDAILNQYPPK